jgi:hypothetical protein
VADEEEATQLSHLSQRKVDPITISMVFMVIISKVVIPT